ncbi:peptidylprolyl isomerase [Tundrisphaera lichenicola]|uniref:peptidylprolyl isomerase n=1 Tax=Tundrisphaera lichenicola TaxID=2029860 RepID=UPI003EBC42E3
MKRPERIRRSSRLNPVESLESRGLMTMATLAPLPDLSLTKGVATPPVNLDAYFKDSQPAPNFAIFDTTLGTIPVLLTPQTTPLTVANFQSYVNKGAYNNTIVHRSVPGFIWQAGGFQLTSQPSISAIASDTPVRNEFGASNVRGTIAMAKLGNDPNSATSQFFFNESNSNAANLDNQNGGFTVFGSVVGTDGLAVMDAIAKVPSPTPAPLASPLDQIPLLNYTAGATVQPSNLVLIKSVSTTSELFFTASDTPGVATATVQGNNLIVSPIAAGTAHITVLGYGSDGAPTAEVFTVNVSSGSDPTTTPPAVEPPSDSSVAQPPPTTSTMPVATSTIPAAQPKSVLSLTAKGPVPSSVIAGQNSRIRQKIFLTSPTSPVVQRTKVALKLSFNPTGSFEDITIANVSKMVRLKAGQQAKLTLSGKKLNPTMAPGTYHLLAIVTDPDGATTTVDTGKTVVVRAPGSKIS